MIPPMRAKIGNPRSNGKKECCMDQSMSSAPLASQRVRSSHVDRTVWVRSSGIFHRVFSVPQNTLIFHKNAKVHDMDSLNLLCFRSFLAAIGAHSTKKTLLVPAPCLWVQALIYQVKAQPRWGYARTSFGVDASTAVTILKCNLWKSWTLELTSEFSPHIWLFLAQCGMLAGFIKTMQAEEMQKYKKYISIFCRVKPKSGEKRKQLSKNHLWTVCLKSSEKIIFAISEIQWQTKIIKMWSNRTSFQVGWSRPTPDVGTIPAR